jgi:DNA polymerase I-like protein with 3'-5' exonuclease and polymerase domains
MVDLPRIPKGTTFALDLETRDPLLDERGPGWCFNDSTPGYVVGYAVATKEWADYYPVKHEGGGNVSNPAGVKRWVADALKEPSNTVIVHNYAYDAGWCRREGIPIRATVRDTQGAAPLINEYRRQYKLDYLAKDYLGVGKDEAPLVAYIKKMNALVRAEATRQFGLDRKAPAHEKAEARKRINRYIMDHKWHPKGDLWRMPGNIVHPYGKQDGRVTYDLWGVLEPLLHAEELWDVFLMETRLLPVLLEMRARGVRVATDEVEQAVARMKREQAALQRQMDQYIGPISVWAEADLSRLAKHIGVVPGKTPTGKDSFRKEWVATQTHPAMALLKNIRRLDKSRSTFLEGYVLDKQVNGRVHGQFHPQKSDEGGAVTGRFSATHPNLQNLPARDKVIKGLVRGAFLPEEGEEWAACDYSQQEPRLTVHYAYIAGCKGARKARKQYVENPDMDYHQFMADITGLARDEVKPINLGVGYGMGPAKLCRSLGLPTKWIEVTRYDKKTGKERKETIEVAGDAGQAILDAYHENAPFVRALTDECQRRAKERGYIKTLAGRRCRLNDAEYGHWTYKAMNRLIQGSAADQTKLAMIACWDAGLVPLVTVHDELGFSVPDRGVARQIAQIMETCVELEVPSKADVELGPSWGQAAEKLKSEQDEEYLYTHDEAEEAA